MGTRGRQADSRRLAKLYFGKDDAESDAVSGGLLHEGFLKTAAYESALMGRKHLIVGRKGSGKSAICMMLAAASSANDSASLITPDEISADEIRRFELPGITAEQSKALLWRYVLAVQVAKYIVSHARHYHQGQRMVAIDTVRDFLIANGELDDLRVHEKFWRLIQRIRAHISLDAFGIKLDIDASAPSPGIEASTTIDVIEQRVADAIPVLRCPRDHPRLILLVDQLEKVWSNDPDSDLMVIGLLSASQHVMSRFPGVRCVVFLRTDIYDALQFQDSDKFHGSEMRIDWNPDRLADLVLRRAQASIGRRIKNNELWGSLFPGVMDGKPTSGYIVDRTLMRPRDVIQLCNLCRDTAEKNGHTVITSADVSEAVVQYSNWKLMDLVNEWRVNYPYLAELLVLFQSSSYVLTREAVELRLTTITNSLAGRYPQHGSAFTLTGVLDILYGVGFLGVIRDHKTTYVYDDPNSIEANEGQFVVHPCFRDALRSTSSVDVPEYEPIVSASRWERVLRGGVHVGGMMGFGERGRKQPEFELAYLLERTVNDVRAMLETSQLPAETRTEVRHNLRRIDLDIQATALALSTGSTGYVEVAYEALYHQVQKVAQFFDELQERLSMPGLLSERDRRTVLPGLSGASQRLLRTARRELHS